MIAYLPPRRSAARHAHNPEDVDRRHLFLRSACPSPGWQFKVMMDEAQAGPCPPVCRTLKRRSCRNVTQRADERISRLYRLHADRREQVDAAKAGDIGVITGRRAHLRYRRRPAPNR